MKVVFLAPYPLNNILTEVVGFGNSKSEHPATWVVNIIKSIKKFYPSIELHIVTESVRIFKSIVFCKDDIFFHIVRSGSSIPFSKRGFPSFLPLDVCTFFLLNRHRLIREIRKINPDLIHAHGTEFSYAFTAATSGYPAIISVQGIINELIKSSWKFRYFILAKLERLTIKRGSFFIAKTSFAKKVISSFNSSAYVFEIENPMNESFFLTKRNKVTEHKSILFVGNIIKEKGIEELIEAMVELPSANLIIVGDGNPQYLTYLKSRIESYGLSGRIKWTGILTPIEISSIMESSSVLVLPSYMETSPNVVSEAICAGLPVIATKVGGIPDMILNEKTGLLIDPQNVQQLVKAIQYILDNSLMSEKMGVAAREENSKRYSPQRIAQLTVDAYRYVLEN